MKGSLVGIVLGILSSTTACLEKAASVHIQNYDGPIFVNDRSVFEPRPAVYDNRPPTLSNLAPTCDQPILHTVPYVSETDCKCITKTIPSTPCSAGPYPQHPDGYYYAYPEYYDQGCFSDGVASPRVSESLVPLLKNYFAQNMGTRSGCQCGNPGFPFSY